MTIFLLLLNVENSQTTLEHTSLNLYYTVVYKENVKKNFIHYYKTFISIDKSALYLRYVRYLKQ